MTRPPVHPHYKGITSMFRQPSTPLTAAQAMMRKKVYDQISKHPDQFDMGWWESPFMRFKVFGDQLVEENTCGTTRCVAGWAQFMAKGEVDSYTVVEDAIREMGLTKEEYYGTAEGQIDYSVKLFHVNDSDAVAWLKRLVEEGFKEIGIDLDDCEEKDEDE